MFGAFKVKKAALALSLYAGLVSIGHAQVILPPVTCNGRAVTQHITSLSQLDSNTVYGTRGNDVIVITIPTSEFGKVTVFLDDTDTYPDGTPVRPGYPQPGGNDAVCATNVPILRIHGGRYVKVRMNTSLVVITKEVDAYLDLISHWAQVTTGNGNDTIFLTVDSRFAAAQLSTVMSGKGNDNIDIVDTRTADYVNSGVAVHAGDGNDVILTEAASSNFSAFVVGGKGNDTITTGNGKDLVYGSDIGYSGITDFLEAVRIFADTGFDVRSYLNVLYSQDTSGGEIATNGGNDYIYGTNGTDYLRGGGGNDTVKAYGARDRLWGGSGNDKLYGGDGDDDVYGESGNDYMEGNDGADLMKGGTGQDEMYGGDGNDEMYGNEDDDEIYGNGDDDVINGDSGNDTCSGGPGTDVLRGCNP